MSSEIIADADHKMARAVEAMERDFQGIRTGRASTPLVERIHVEYYGTQTPLNQLAGISVPEPHQIVIQPWDRGVLGAIEKAITKSDIGLMPNVDGTVVRLNIPPLTEERRKDLVKVVHKRMEEARVEIRNLRRDAADHLKKEERDGAVGADESHRQLEIAPEDHRPAHRRGRPPWARPRNRRSWRSSGPRTPLARPTDAPPAAHEPIPSTDAAIVPAATPVDRADDGPTTPPDDLPRHVAIIMDGNRRWARQRDLPELEGHAAGVEAIRELLRHAVRRGVPVLTLYAFSRENWARSDDEVTGLFGLLEGAIRSETDELRAPGRARPAPRPPRRAARRDARVDRRGARGDRGRDRLLLNIAFNYAGRTELVDAVRRLVASGVTPPTRSTRRPSARALYTAGLPDPDLVIRTGGEQRLSNFLIWQSAYAEFYFCETLWPDFGPDAFDEALGEFARRHRRFGR